MQTQLLVLIASALAFAGQAEAQTYKIDPVHSAVVFRVSHLGFSSTYGQFPKVDGSFTLDEAKAENTKIDLKIDAASVMTHDAKRDKHLKSPDFFNVKQNPSITFKSTAVKKTAENKYNITGDLSLNGVTKSVSFDFVRGRTGQDPWGMTRTGGDATLKIKRSDYKMTYMSKPNEIGDDVELLLSVEGIRQ